MPGGGAQAPPESTPAWPGSTCFGRMAAAPKVGRTGGGKRQGGHCREAVAALDARL